MEREEKYKYFTIRLITTKDGKECYQVRRNDTKKIKSKCTTLANAKKQVNILTDAIERKIASKMEKESEMSKTLTMELEKDFYKYFNIKNIAKAGRNCFQVVRISNGDILLECTSLRNAEKQVKMLNGIEAKKESIKKNSPKKPSPKKSVARKSIPAPKKSVAKKSVAKKSPKTSPNKLLIRKVNNQNCYNVRDTETKIILLSCVSKAAAEKYVREASIKSVSPKKKSHISADVSDISVTFTVKHGTNTTKKSIPIESDVYIKNMIENWLKEHEKKTSPKVSPKKTTPKKTTPKKSPVKKVSKDEYTNEDLAQMSDAILNSMDALIMPPKKLMASSAAIKKHILATSDNKYKGKKFNALFDRMLNHLASNKLIINEKTSYRYPQESDFPKKIQKSPSTKSLEIQKNNERAVEQIFGIFEENQREKLTKTQIRKLAKEEYNVKDDILNNLETILEILVVQEKINKKDKKYSLSAEYMEETPKSVKKKVKTNSNYVFFFGKDSPLSPSYPVRYMVDGLIFNSIEQGIGYERAKKKYSETSEWDKDRKDIFYKHTYAKFSQNKELYNILMKYEPNSVFVFASPSKRVWGIGMDAKEAELVKKDQWKGLNLLGKAITKVRDTFIKEKFVA